MSTVNITTFTVEPFEVEGTIEGYNVLLSSRRGSWKLFASIGEQHPYDGVEVASGPGKISSKFVATKIIVEQMKKVIEQMKKVIEDQPRDEEEDSFPTNEVRNAAAENATTPPEVLEVLVAAL